MSGAPSHVQTNDSLRRATQAAEAEEVASESLDAKRDRLTVQALEAQIALTGQQLGLARNERFRNRLKAARDGSLTLLTVMLAAAAVFVVWDSRRADGLVIEPFQTHPALADAGLTGEDVANRLLTQVTAIQTAVPSSRRQRSALSSTDQIAVEIPSTGLSITEATRMLRRRLGREQMVTGRLDLNAEGAPLVAVYIDGEPLDIGSVEPRDGETPAQAAIRAAAESLFREAEPYRYAIWLSGQGRVEEAQDMLRLLTLTGSSEDRAWAHVGLASLGQAEGRLAPMVEEGRRALELEPALPNAIRGLAQAYHLLGMHGWADRLRREALEANDGSAAFREREFNDRYWVATHGQDHRSALEWAERMTSVVQPGGNVEEPLFMKADALARLHDVTGAQRLEALSSAPPQPGDRGHKLSAVVQRPAVGDWAGLEADLTNVSRQDAPASGVVWSEDQWLYRPWLAIALARQGRPAEAELVMGTDDDFGCVLCREAWGEIAVARGDRAEAERRFAEAADMANGLPGPLLRWGEARLRLGDPEGALDLARRVRARAPAWADALKLEADALMAQGRTGSAISRYQEAAELAPRWGAVRLAMARVLAATGDATAADFHRRAALDRDLSPSDRVAARSLAPARPES